MFDPFAALGFTVLDQRCNELCWMHANEYMDMVGHAIYLQHFVTIGLHNTRYIFMQLCIPYFLNQSCTVFYGKYKLNMDLCVGVCHIS